MAGKAFPRGTFAKNAKADVNEAALWKLLSSARRFPVARSKAAAPPTSEIATLEREGSTETERKDGNGPSGNRPATTGRSSAKGYRASSPSGVSTATS